MDEEQALASVSVEDVREENTGLGALLGEYESDVESGSRELYGGQGHEDGENELLGDKNKDTCE